MITFNAWRTLFANLGVLVGLVFLNVELNPSKRIAVYSAESTSRSQFPDMNTSRIENPEIIARVMQANPDLDEIEWVQALYTARQQTKTWIDAENAHINGLLSDETHREIFNDIDTVVQEMPGLIPASEYLFEAYKVDENSQLATIAYLSISKRALCAVGNSG